MNRIRIVSEGLENRTGGNFKLVILFSGLIGFGLGLSNATWQVTVETGQVLAGIVSYPPDNPFYMYHLKVFTIINQISTVLLRLIGSERLISIFISGLLGMISFQAIASVIFAINRSVFWSVLGVVFIYFTNYVGDGVVYPIWFLGQPHTYGILGLSFIVLTVGLLGAGSYRAGLFCLGLAPCVHPSLGSLLWLIFLITAAIRFCWAKEIIKSFYPFLLAGLAVSFLSLGYQLYLMRDLPAVAAEVKKQYFDSYIRYWGSHQQKLYWGYPSSGSFKRWGLFFCGYSVIGSLVGIKLLKNNKTAGFVFTFISVSGILALCLGFITQIPPEKIPSVLLIFMPGRFFNFNNIVLVPVLLGMLTREVIKPSVTNYNIFILFIISSFFSRHSEVQIVILGLIILWLWYICGKQSDDTGTSLLKTRAHKVSYEPLLIIFMAAFFAINLPREKFVNSYLVHPGDMHDYTNNSFYKTISQRQGMLISTHAFAMIPLKTKRPILVDMGSPNTLTYAPEGGPAFNEILKKIYGVDLLVPPAEELRNREILPGLYKDLWQSRTPEQWRRVLAEYNVTDILATDDFKLKLPVIASEGNMVLYGVPAEDASE